MRLLLCLRAPPRLARIHYYTYFLLQKMSPLFLCASVRCFGSPCWPWIRSKLCSLRRSCLACLHTFACLRGGDNQIHKLACRLHDKGSLTSCTLFCSCRRQTRLQRAGAGAGAGGTKPGLSPASTAQHRPAAHLKRTM